MNLIIKLAFSIPLVVRWIFSVIYLAVIAYGSLSPTNKLPNLLSFHHLDKLLHFMMYFIFCIVGIWTFDIRKIISGRLEVSGNKIQGKYQLIFLLAVIWGISMEIFQRLMHMGRDYSIYDMLANTAGAIAGTVLYHYFFVKQSESSLSKR